MQPAVHHDVRPQQHDDHTRCQREIGILGGISGKRPAPGMLCLWWCVPSGIAEDKSARATRGERNLPVMWRTLHVSTSLRGGNRAIGATLEIEGISYSARRNRGRIWTANGVALAPLRSFP